MNHRRHSAVLQHSDYTGLCIDWIPVVTRRCSDCQKSRRANGKFREKKRRKTNLHSACGTDRRLTAGHKMSLLLDESFAAPPFLICSHWVEFKALRHHWSVPWPYIHETISLFLIRSIFCLQMTYDDIVTLISFYFDDLPNKISALRRRQLIHRC